MAWIRIGLNWYRLCSTKRGYGLQSGFLLAEAGLGLVILIIGVTLFMGGLGRIQQGVVSTRMLLQAVTLAQSAAPVQDNVNGFTIKYHDFAPPKPDRVSPVLHEKVVKAIRPSTCTVAWQDGKKKRKFVCLQPKSV